MDDGRYVYTDKDGNVVANETQMTDNISFISDRGGKIIRYHTK